MVASAYIEYVANCQYQNSSATPYLMPMSRSLSLSCFPPLCSNSAIYFRRTYLIVPRYKTLMGLCPFVRHGVNTNWFFWHHLPGFTVIHRLSSSQIIKIRLKSNNTSLTASYTPLKSKLRLTNSLPYYIDWLHLEVRIWQNLNLSSSNIPYSFRQHQFQLFKSLLALTIEKNAANRWIGYFWSQFARLK